MSHEATAEQAQKTEQHEPSQSQKDEFDLSAIKAMISHYKAEIDKAATFFNTSEDLISFVMNLMLNTHAQVVANFFSAINLTDDSAINIRRNILNEYAHQCHMFVDTLVTMKHEEWHKGNIPLSTVQGTTTPGATH